MSWNTLLGCDTQRLLLRRSIEQNRLAHTFLFVGPEGIGKRTFARLFAQSLLCETCPPEQLDVCDRCPGCKQVLRGSHPDLFEIGLPEGKRELTIDLFLGPPEQRGQAGLCYELSRTPVAGGRKIAIVDDADALNEASSNALLKTLEEPPARSLLILIARQSDNLLATIRSRCQALRFQPLATDQVAELLLRHELADDRRAAEAAAALSDGSVTGALPWLDPAAQAERKTVSEHLAAGVTRPVAFTDWALERLEEAGTDAPSQRLAAGRLVRLCSEFYRTTLQRMHAEERADPDDVEFLLQLQERVLETERHIDQNVGVSLCLESLFDDLARRNRTRV